MEALVIPTCVDEAVCCNIDAPFCHCLSCLKANIGLNVWGECIDCQSCMICVQYCADLLPNGRCQKCDDMLKEPGRCSLCWEKAEALLETGQCAACQICPPGCGNWEAPYCHCIGSGCGKRISPLNEDGECVECAAVSAASMKEVADDRKSA